MASKWAESNVCNQVLTAVLTSSYWQGLYQSGADIDLSAYLLVNPERFECVVEEVDDAVFPGPIFDHEIGTSDV